jgi:hypothetical protein
MTDRDINYKLKKQYNFLKFLLTVDKLVLVMTLYKKPKLDLSSFIVWKIFVNAVKIV